MKAAIILGSSRINGNTAKLAHIVSKYLPAPIYNLHSYNISEFDYEHKNRDDDFLPLIDKLSLFDLWIFASPIYWYAPSSKMKIFLDRLSDLLIIEKNKGRKLRGKNTAVLATGTDTSPQSCFEDIFKYSSNYLGMNYKTMCYCRCNNQFVINHHTECLIRFIQDLNLAYRKTI